MTSSAVGSAIADQIFFNGNVLTMDADDRVVQAIAVRGEHIIATGPNESMKVRGGPDTEWIDLEGRTVLPGFIDGHVHPTSAMIVYDRWRDARHATTPSVAVLLDKIRGWAAETPPGEWMLLAGTPASDLRFAERRLPTHAELDAASGNAAVMYVCGMHKWVVSTAGLAKLGISRGMNHYKGAFIELDADGEPTGIVSEGGAIAPGRSATDADLNRMYTRQIPEFWNSRGYTSMLAITPKVQFEEIKRIAAAGGGTGLRYTFAVNADPGGTLLPPLYNEFHMPETADPNWFRFVGAKLWVDGDVPARGGYTYEPYCGPYHDCGVANISPKKLDAFVLNVRRQGLACYLHATGDRATDRALEAFERAQEQEPDTPTMQRIEHFGDFMLTREQMARAMHLGVMGNCQPGWLHVHSLTTDGYLGEARSRRLAFQFRTMIDSGLEPGFGSDLTGIIKETENPFFHIWCAVARISPQGPFVPEQAITRQEALRMMTIWAARAQGEDAIKGSLEVGKLADMIVLSDDILRVPVESLRELTVLQTIVGGRTVWRC